MIPEDCAQALGDGGEGITRARLELPISNVPIKARTIETKLLIARALWDTDMVPHFLHELVQYPDVAVRATGEPQRLSSSCAHAHAIRVACGCCAANYSHSRRRHALITMC